MVTLEPDIIKYWLVLEIVKFSPKVTVTDDAEIVQGPLEFASTQAWSIVIDADILLLAGRISKFVELLGSVSGSNDTVLIPS